MYTDRRPLAPPLPKRRRHPQESHYFSLISITTRLVRHKIDCFTSCIGEIQFNNQRKGVAMILLFSFHSFLHRYSHCWKVFSIILT